VTTVALRALTLRELRQRLRDKGFVATAIFAAVGAVIASIAILGERNKVVATFVVGSITAQDREIAGAAQLLGKPAGVRVLRKDAGRPARARERLRGEDFDAVLDHSRVVVERRLDARLRLLLDAGAARVQAHRRGIHAPAALNVVALNSEASDDDRRLAVALLLLSFALVYIFGYFVASATVEEKASRVVEVVLAHASPRHLLAAKLLAVGVLGVVLFAGLAALIVAVGARGRTEVDAGTVAVALAAVVGFVFSYAFWGCVFAMSGAVVSRQEDLQYSVLTPTLLLVVCFFASSSQINDLGGPVARFLSFVPPLTPLLMPVRAAAGEASAGAVAAAVVLTVVSVAAMVRVAARIYEGSVLRFGDRVALGEAWGAKRR
jgi:ABC-2 type transport system permease protein